MYENEKEILKNKEKFTADDLRLIVKILRSPGGCPWDAEQNHKSIISGLVEECYEAVEAIEADNADMLCEELGDVLLQVVFHALLEEEQNSFNFDDVVSGVCKKMIIRHPHVFGDVVANDSATVLKNWDKIKAETKQQKNLSERLNAIARPLPALIRAQKVIHKISKEQDVPSLNNSERLKADELGIGKTLFDTIKECEKLNIDAETALRHYTDAIIDSIE